MKEFMTPQGSLGELVLQSRVSIVKELNFEETPHVTLHKLSAKWNGLREASKTARGELKSALHLVVSEITSLKCVEEQGSNFKFTKEYPQAGANVSLDWHVNISYCTYHIVLHDGGWPLACLPFTGLPAAEVEPHFDANTVEQIMSAQRFMATQPIHYTNQFEHKQAILRRAPAHRFRLNMDAGQAENS